MVAPRRTIGLMLFASLTLAATTGCASHSSSEYYDQLANEPPEEVAVEDYEPDDWEIPESDHGWMCSYSPTYNDDWHDDVLCINGNDSQRPYLLEGESFVTEAEIMAAAAEFEAQLNGGSVPAAALDDPAAPSNTGASVSYDVGWAQQYESVTELKDAAVSAGYYCQSWTQNNNVSLASGSGNCSDRDVFSTFANAADVQTQVNKTVKGSKGYAPVHLLIGPNWIINTHQPDLSELARVLGGAVLELSE
ncbi:hypothetical protein GCM10010460_13490 [Microbacterium terrae]|uniref:Uncharacterized protein n=2 Tax=Microbacterium terrae TaxID=69369 RepID=A0A0M2H3J6_9MICO|nr:hypothetical protein RS81_02651 [Microbacterium terrae]GLJ98378.1 hypothetical protein GCM10017594_15750 [Microbacterium terrae]